MRLQSLQSRIAEVEDHCCWLKELDRRRGTPSVVEIGLTKKGCTVGGALRCTALWGIEACIDGCTEGWCISAESRSVAALQWC